MATTNHEIEEQALTGTRRRGIHEVVRGAIRDRVLDGRLAAGSRIDEKALCEQLNVSRTPIREALKVLAAEGLIELLPNKGSRVIGNSATRIRHLFSVIASLERLAAELVCKTASDKELKVLREMHTAMETFFHARNRHEYFELNHKIHESIIALTRNPELVRAHAELMIRARSPRFIAITSVDRWNESIKEHALLTGALELREARFAGEILFRHVVKTGEAYIQTLQQNFTER
jgi:DNA-binding GntR family transcriptional regulator